MKVYLLRLRFWFHVSIFCRYYRFKAWALWLPHRALRRSLHAEFKAWGTPLDTLKDISKRLERTENHLNHAHQEWGKSHARACRAELLLAADRVDQGSRNIILNSLGIDLRENRN